MDILLCCSGLCSEFLGIFQKSPGSVKDLSGDACHDVKVSGFFPETTWLQERSTRWLILHNQFSGFLWTA